jgi:hypothetical protein
VMSVAAPALLAANPAAAKSAHTASCLPCICVSWVEFVVVLCSQGAAKPAFSAIATIWATNALPSTFSQPQNTTPGGAERSDHAKENGADATSLALPKTCDFYQ